MDYELLNTQKGQDFINACLCVNCRLEPPMMGVRFSDERPNCSNCGRKIDEKEKPLNCEHDDFKSELGDNVGMCIKCFKKWINNSTNGDQNE